MARILGFVNAILAGKLDGTVYSRNKSGNYLKSYSRPLDPKSSAQMSNRANFVSVASSWHSLTDTQKQKWADFAENHFIGKHPGSMSAVSGFNAYIALQTSANFCQAKKRVNTTTTPTGGTVAFTAFGSSADAPLNALSGQIQDSVGASLGLTLVGGSLEASTGKVTASLQFNRILTAKPTFQDSVTHEPVGILIAASSGMSQIASFVSKPGIRVVNVMAPPTLTFTTWTGANLTIQAAGPDLNIGSFKQWYTTGQVVQLSCYLVGATGQQKFLGAQKITVT